MRRGAITCYGASPCGCRRRSSTSSGSSSPCGFSPPLRDHARCFSSEEDVYDYPKRLLPQDLSTETMRFFLDFPGMTDALWRSVIVAVATLALSLAIGTPAGYALARFAFGRGHGAALGRRH